MRTRATLVPYFDLVRQYETLRPEMEKVFRRIAESGRYILGEEVRKFEASFARYCGTSFAAGVGSGTDALIFSLKALGIGKGDEVIVPSFTFSASVFAVLHAGAVPKFAEVDPDTYTLDPESAANLVTRRTRAILPVHLYGQTADMDALGAIARRRNLKIVEDACQAHGAEWKKKKAGSLGDAGAFSFYPTKNLGALGDGGMVTTAEKNLAEKIFRYRNLGRVTLQEPHRVLGETSRLDTLQAAFLNVKLRRLEEWIRKRRRLAALYKKYLARTPVIPPAEHGNARHVYHLFVIRVPDRRCDALRGYLQKKRIPTMIHYPVPAHRQPACRGYAKGRLRLPVTEKLCGEILSLPFFPEMRVQEIEKVCDAIGDFYA